MSKHKKEKNRKKLFFFCFSHSTLFVAHFEKQEHMYARALYSDNMVTLKRHCGLRVLRERSAGAYKKKISKLVILLYATAHTK